MISWKCTTGFLYQKNYAVREQYIGETERERECVGDSALLEMRESVGNKIGCWRKYL